MRTRSHRPDCSQRARPILGPAPLAARQAEIDRCFAGGLGGGNRRQPGGRRHSDWAAETLETLRQKSPTSLKVTYKQLTEYGERDFEEAMALEYRLAMHCNLGVDFFEGIRAQIVDKDRNPAWRPARLEEVTAAAVDAYFERAAQGRHDVVSGRERRSRR